MRFLTIICIIILPITILKGQELLNNDYFIDYPDQIYPQHKILVDSNLLQNLDNALETSASEIGIIGASCAINFPNGETWTGVFGKNTDEKLIKPENSFAIGSVSKSIAATCILKLEEENLLSIDDTIGQWVANPNIDPTITIRQCLNHTSGISDLLRNPNFLITALSDPSKIWDAEELISKYLLEPLFDKGTDWEYSNTNYLIAGIIIQKVTGKPYHEVVRNKVLDPIGLPNIQLYPQESLNTELVKLWNDVLDGKPLKGFFSSAWAAGAYVSTPSDIAIWMKKLAKGEILSSSSMEEMLDLVTKNDQAGYGLGIVKITTNDLTLYGHNGDISYRSSVYYIKELDISIAVHTNDGSSKGKKLRDILVKLIETYVGYLTPSNDIQASFIPFEIFPNPVSSKLQLKFSDQQSHEISIYNHIGQKMDTYQSNQSNIEISTESLLSGTYFIRIKSKNNITTKTFIKP